MRQRRTQGTVFIVIVSIGIAFMGFGSVILRLIIAVAGSVILFLKKEYILAAIAAFIIGVSLYVADVYLDLFLVFSRSALATIRISPLS